MIVMGKQRMLEREMRPIAGLLLGVLLGALLWTVLALAVILR